MIKERMTLRGCFRILFLYDVAEEINLEILQNLLGSRGEPLSRPFPRRTPQYVQFERMPIVEPAEPLLLDQHISAQCSVKYFSFGVVSVQVEVPFASDWDALIAENSRWMDEADVGASVRQLAQRHLQRVASAITRPTQDWLHETYLVTEIHQIIDLPGSPPTAEDLLAAHGPQIVQLVRGETAELAPRACEETLKGSLSYYAQDLVVVGSYGAVVYDSPEGAAASAQVLEFARMQLLEFRYYDRLMTRVLADFYDSLERKRNILLSRWSLPRDAQRFNTVRLDVMELTERIDNAIKFVSDIYYARIYELAATRIGLLDYRVLVDEKLKTAGDLYDFMVDQFNESRSFVLEVCIAILAVLDVIFWLRWR
jgi:hypothetical protein